VNNNAYTNLMAQENLRIAISAVELLRVRAPEAFARLVRTTGLDLSELAEWQRAADRMYVPYDRTAESLEIEHEGEPLRLEPGGVVTRVVEPLVPAAS
jgi:trehalose/maltose hydrolase-like predicted phosphorylase